MRIFSVGGTGLMLARTKFSGSQHCSNELGLDPTRRAHKLWNREARVRGPREGKVEAHAVIGGALAALHCPYFKPYPINIAPFSYADTAPFSGGGFPRRTVADAVVTARFSGTEEGGTTDRDSDLRVHLRPQSAH